MAKATPKPTYAIRVTPVRSDDVMRVVELRADQGLRDLARAVSTEFGEDANSAWSFFVGGRPWERAAEYASEGRGKTAKAAGLALAVGTRFWFAILGESEQWFRCEVTALSELDPKAKYPRVTEKKGEAAGPLGDFGFLLGGAKGRGLADEDDDDGEDALDDDDELAADGDEPLVMNDALRALADRTATAVHDYDAHFDGVDSAAAPRAQANVTRDLALARELVAQFGAHAGQWEEFVEATGEEVDEWLEMLPFDLQDHALRDEAIALCTSLAELLDPADVLATRAQLLAEAGRADDAAAQCEDLLERFPDQHDVRLRCARVFLKLGNHVRAEELAWSVYNLDLDFEDALDYLDAIEVLGVVLRASGRGAEADELERSEKAEQARAYDPDAPNAGNILEDMFGQMLGAAGGGHDDGDADDASDDGADFAVDGELIEGQAAASTPPADADASGPNLRAPRGAPKPKPRKGT